MQILKDFILTHTDVKGCTSLLIHIKVGCNLHCFNCYNYEDLIINKEKQEWIDDSKLFEYIEQNSSMFDAVILSGGEPTLLIPDLIIFCKIFKAKYPTIKLVLNTNGTRPDTIKYLIDNHLIDSVYIDVKFPLGKVKEEDIEVWEKIYGIKFNKKIPKAIDKSLEIVYNSAIHVSFRTVYYPFVSATFIKQIQDDIQRLNKKYKRTVEHIINPFYIRN